MENSAKLHALTQLAEKNNRIAAHHYQEKNIKRGLRNADGTGVAVGFTQIGDVKGYDIIDGEVVPVDGCLFYRGINVESLVKGAEGEGRFGFEEAAFLLLFGKLPTEQELDEFKELLDEYRVLPPQFTENMILKIPSRSVMNKLQRSILVLYSHDDNPDDTSIDNVLLQSIKLIARIPTIIAYGYQSMAHNFHDQSLFIHAPLKGKSTAENVLHLLRADNSYTALEAETLDLCMMLHAEHGGGNNSTFATHVVTSSGTDTYSAIATAVGALKGNKHGGASYKVKDMVDHIKSSVDCSDEQALADYIDKIMAGEVFDGLGLIYGMGHAVYKKSDPRAVLLKRKARELAVAMGKLEDYELYEKIEMLAKKAFKAQRGEAFEICANVDFYSGFVYELLNIPKELYTPIFAASRVVGWCAHRMEQLLSDQKIMRPAYKTLGEEVLYQKIVER
ncbi:MAG: citrate synthase [Clostridia bacterium]|nr:citrate synthase [Clostridia bacterium]